MTNKKTQLIDSQSVGFLHAYSVVSMVLREIHETRFRESPLITKDVLQRTSEEERSVNYELKN